jgi:hypothetical protein
MIRAHFGHQLPDGLMSPDAYFTPGYGRAASVSDGGDWVLLEGFDGAWQVPLIVRTLRNGTKDAISPYGFSGVYAAPSLSSAQVQQAWSETLACLGELSVISVLLRHSPLVPQAPHPPGQKEGQKFIVRGHPTIVVEPVDDDSAWKSMEHNCRTATRKALKNGYTGEVRPATSQDIAPGSDFRRLYEQTMQRRDAAPLYLYSDKYYSELLDGLGPDLLVFEVRDDRGEVASSSLNLRHADRIHGHLAGSNTQDARMGSNNLMIWTATQFAIEQGLGQFHLGGGLDARDSLFKFKQSFGGRELEYCVSGMVIDPELYQGHTEARAEELKTTSEALLAANYFPAYRAGAQ